ncbi:MAG: mobilization protein [Betaproteobacteria bacterium]|nr:mobilization protein [Betaproteobacteria bacterium]
MATIEERRAAADRQIDDLKKRLDEAKAKKQKIDAGIKARQSKKERAADNRRKILLGAFVLENLKKDGISAVMFTYAGKRFDEWLKRPDDRALFGMKPEPTPIDLSKLDQQRPI